MANMLKTALEAVEQANRDIAEAKRGHVMEDRLGETREDAALVLRESGAGLTYREIGARIGAIKDGHPICTEHVRQMINRARRRRARRQRYASSGYVGGSAY
jgi:hypothetical protein